MTKFGKCLNGCGDMIFLEKPAWILIDFEIMDHLPDDVKARVTVCTLIMAFCPKCGYTISRSLKMAEWQQFLKSLK